jgi:nucleoside diphosphate kinase
MVLTNPAKGEPGTISSRFLLHPRLKNVVHSSEGVEWLLEKLLFGLKKENHLRL